MIEFYNCKECKIKTPHSVINELGDYNEIYQIKCAGCASEQNVSRKEWFFTQYHEDISNSDKPRKAYLTKYPRTEWCTGQTVTSKDHEREVTKRMGYTPVE